MYKVSNPIPHCILFEFNNKKDLTFCFCRPQEYYESDKPKLNGKFFSFYEFVDEQTDSKGNINYFEYWDGFNLPCTVYDKWINGIGVSNLTKHEKLIYQEIVKSNRKNANYYIIAGMLGDRTNTIKHELAHAMYTLKSEAKKLGNNNNYSQAVKKLNEEFSSDFPKEYDKIIKGLKRQGYGENVLLDEVQAYMSTSLKDEFVDEFKLNYDSLLPMIKKYRSNFNKYYKQK